MLLTEAWKAHVIFFWKLGKLFLKASETLTGSLKTFSWEIERYLTQAWKASSSIWHKLVWWQSFPFITIYFNCFAKVFWKYISPFFNPLQQFQRDALVLVDCSFFLFPSQTRYWERIEKCFTVGSSSLPNNPPPPSNCHKLVYSGAVQSGGCHSLLFIIKSLFRLHSLLLVKERNYVIIFNWIWGKCHHPCRTECWLLTVIVAERYHFTNTFFTPKSMAL